jgi:hypothetical protein
MTIAERHAAAIRNMPGTKGTARSEIAPYPGITAKRGVYEVGRALRARRSEAGSAILRIAALNRGILLVQRDAHPLK